MKKVIGGAVIFGFVALYVFAGSYMTNNNLTEESVSIAEGVTNSTNNIIINNNKETLSLNYKEESQITEEISLDEKIQLALKDLYDTENNQNLTADNQLYQDFQLADKLSLDSDMSLELEDLNEFYSSGDSVGPISEEFIKGIISSGSNSNNFLEGKISENEILAENRLDNVSADKDILDKDRLENDMLDNDRMEEKKKTPSLYDQIKVHEVVNGDNLWDIARKYDIDIDTLIGANDITNMNTIRIGDELRILPIKGILYTVNPGESLWSISRKFNISSSKIVEANDLSNPDRVSPGISLVLPGVKPEFGYQDRLAESFMRPVTGGRISSPFGPRWGRMHSGIDYAIPTGTQVMASRAGKIVYSGWSTGYGETVIIEHQKGVRSLYAHNSRLLVKSGQHVERGQAIALSGNTGNSTGPHLHFEIQINGKPVNPANYLPR
ncbi:MAG: peptidoglycan DD-metalloendopeptidase family protein [Halanaerobiales bacterium]